MMMITILSPEINLLLLTIEKTWKSIAKIVMMMAMTVMTMTMMAARRCGRRGKLRGDDAKRGWQRGLLSNRGRIGDEEDHFRQDYDRLIMFSPKTMQTCKEESKVTISLLC